MIFSLRYVPILKEVVLKQDQLGAAMLAFALAVLHQSVTAMAKTMLALGGILHQNGICQRLVLQNPVTLFEAILVFSGNRKHPALFAFFLALKANDEVEEHSRFHRSGNGSTTGNGSAIVPFACYGRKMRGNLDLLDHAKTAFSPKHFLGIGENTDQKADDDAEHTGTDLHVKGLHGRERHDRSKDDQGAKEEYLDHLFAAQLSDMIPNLGIILDQLLFKFLYGLHNNQL